MYVWCAMHREIYTEIMVVRVDFLDVYICILYVLQHGFSTLHKFVCLRAKNGERERIKLKIDFI